MYYTFSYVMYYDTNTNRRRVYIVKSAASRTRMLYTLLIKRKHLALVV